ncbi:MAG: cytochrome c biogenesis protein ResB [Dehalococcoidia bacterium]|nr:cytochrome c biogenesis protein ResB [Dehalococcoidia bacterium]
MAFVAVFGALGAWIPQSPLGNTETLAIWQEKNPLVARVADAVGLYDIFSSWWFLGALAVLGVALGIATARMVGETWHIRSGGGRRPRTLLCGAPVEPIVQRAKEMGFRQRRSLDGRYVLTRHELGVWAPSVLHVGMLLSLAWATLMLSATNAGVVGFLQGEVRNPGSKYPTIVEASRPPELSVPWRFDGMEVSTWSSGLLKSVSATFSFFEGDAWTERVSSVNNPLRFRGHTIYVQPGEFGDAALLRITDGAGAEHRIRMEFSFIEDDQPTYTAPIMIGSAAIEGRWDPYGVRDTRPLGLRPAGDDSAEPVTLVPGETATVAGLTVEFVAVAQWARFIVQSSPSATPLFIGFAVIALGSLMLYAWIPRELVLEETAEGVRYSWHAARIPQSYLAERDAILGQLEREREER